MSEPIAFDLEVDPKGLNCPLPILKAKKALSAVESGQIVKIISTDPASRRDFEAFARQTGNAIVAQDQADARVADKMATNQESLGDAAGLVDTARGVGMDAAALSGRLAAKAIVSARTGKRNAMDEYTRYARKMVDQTRRNQSGGIGTLGTNEALVNYLGARMWTAGIHTAFNLVLNCFRQPESVTLLP